MGTETAKNRLTASTSVAVAALSLWSAPASAQSWEANRYRNHFQEAYRLNPTVPKGILEAVAFANTRINHLQPGQEEEHHGMPSKYGVMGLIRDGMGVFRNSLQEVAALSGYAEENVAKDPRINILAFAKAYGVLIAKSGVESRDPSQQLGILQALSELPDGSAMHEFAMDSHLYEVMHFLTSTRDRSRFGFPDYKLKLETVFGPNRFAVLSSPRVMASPGLVQGSNGGLYKQSGAQAACQDYPTALWSAAHPGNYNSRNGTPVTAITLHTMQGSYAGSISWFKNPSSQVSAHYCMRARDGQVTQMVCESDRAWHVGFANSYTVGIEHEGWVEQDGWYTDVVYEASAKLTLDIARNHKIDPTSCYKGAGTSGVKVLGEAYRIKGHQHFDGQTHVDPGPKWNWAKFYTLLNPVTEVLKPVSGRQAASLGFMAAIPENFRGHIYQANGQSIRKVDAGAASSAAAGRSARLPSVIMFTDR